MWLGSQVRQDCANLRQPLSYLLIGHRATRFFSLALDRNAFSGLCCDLQYVDIRLSPAFWVGCAHTHIDGNGIPSREIGSHQFKQGPAKIPGAAFYLAQAIDQADQSIWGIR